MNFWKTHSLRVWTVVLFLGMTGLGASTGAAQTKTDGPIAEAMLRRLADYYKTVKSMSVEVAREQKLGANALKSSIDITVERPAKLAVRTKGASFGIDLVSDGNTMSIAIPALKRYTQMKAPASIAELGNDPISRGVLITSLQGTMLMELAADDPYKALMDGVNTAAWVGEENLGGIKTHHLKCTQEQFDWEAWISADGDPLLQKVVVDMTKSFANTPAAARFKGQKLELTQTFKNWKINIPPDAKSFVFEPAPGLKKADSLMEALGGGGQQASSPLVGKHAPDISLKLLDKGELRLEDHRDKNILILDFWATWCGPCVQELPILTEIAEAYKDKGVAFFGINLKETSEQIKTFQTEKKLNFTVALDTDGDVGTAYGAQAIPMLVLVDKKGVVQSVHVGYDPSIKTTLTKELDALIAGKDLSKEAAERTKAGKAKS